MCWPVIPGIPALLRYPVNFPEYAVGQGKGKDLASDHYYRIEKHFGDM